MGQELLSEGATATRERTEVRGDRWSLDNAQCRGFSGGGGEMSRQNTAADLVECCRRSIG